MADLMAGDLDLDAFLENYIQQLHESNAPPTSGQPLGGMAQFGATQGFAPGQSHGAAAVPHGMGFPNAQGGMGMGMVHPIPAPGMMGHPMPGADMEFGGMGMGGMGMGMGMGGFQGPLEAGGLGNMELGMGSLESMDINTLLQQAALQTAMTGGGAQGEQGSPPTGSGASGSAPKGIKGKAKTGRPAPGKPTSVKDEEEGLVSGSESEEDEATRNRKRQATAGMSKEDLRHYALQEKNRRAQRRFRERQKNKLHDLHKQIDELTNKVGSLQSENTSLHSRTNILEKVLDMRNEQIQVMQETKETSHLSADEDDPVAQQGVQGQLVQLTPENVKALSSEQMHSIYQMYIKELSVRLTDEAALSPTNIEEIQRLVKDLSMMIMRLGVIKPLETRKFIVMSRQRLGNSESEVIEVWKGVMKTIDLSDEQKREVVNLKAMFLQKIDPIMAERKLLNLQIQSNLPHDTFATKNALMYIKAHEAVMKLRDNLRAEQHVVLEFAMAFFRGVFKPWQMATLLVKCYPVVPDALGIASALSAELGEADQPHTRQLTMQLGGYLDAQAGAMHGGQLIMGGAMGMDSSAWGSGGALGGDRTHRLGVFELPDRLDPSLDILACFTIVDLVQYIGMGHAELDDFGNDSFQQLKDHFWSGDGLPNSPFSARGESFMATLDTEFKHVKTVIKDRLALTPSATMLNLWRFIARSSDSLMVPNIILLMNVYYVMALHTAEVERGFSIHRILKNRLRSRLMILMVDSLLRIWHLAQSFTGPRESENNSLINEAAEKLSGASLQSQGVNPPSLLKRLVEEVSRVQVSFRDRDLDEAARLLEKEGLEDVDPAVAFDVEGNIVEEEDAGEPDELESDEDDFPLIDLKKR
ncbi:hypothetical protein FOA52_014836 [Chlamydomonas sp. UWO 241]|nr:hypothetical protein FOA52_014836 [Chlamydomonas sp. UWO 241]